jgi:pyruvate-formate lyase-activating enzyme
MKANNLTISIPNMGCDKNCKYCVSKCTGSVETNCTLMYRNIDKVLNLARMSQVSSVMLTGKGEPFLNLGDVYDFTRRFKEFPLEIQTNGIWLNKNRGRISELAELGMNVIAVSVDAGDMVLLDLSHAIHEAGMLLRVTFNVTNKEALLPRTSFQDLLNAARDLWGADQLTLRNIVVPNYTKHTLQSRWIKNKKNVDPRLYQCLQAELIKMCQKKGHHIRSLPYGAEVYDLQGVAVSYSDYCIQDGNNTEDIRSLILQDDGHVYTSWASKASILF